MPDRSLLETLREHERNAVNFRDGLLAEEQAENIDYYDAQPFGDEKPGRSRVVVPEVAEVCDYMLVSVLRTLMSSGRVFEFQAGDTEELPTLPEEPQPPNLPEGDEQTPQGQQAMQQFQAMQAAYKAAVAHVDALEAALDQAADDATEGVNHAFLRGQNGYRVLIDFIQSGAVEKFGAVKVACVTERKKVMQPPATVDDEGLTMMQMSEQPFAHQDNGDGTHQVTPLVYRESKTYRTMPIPSEEFLFTPLTTSEDECPYLAHRSRKTVSDLIGMGFDRQQVEGLPIDDGDNLLDDPRALARWRDEDEFSPDRNVSLREVRLLEEYVMIDRDGDGIAERWQFFRVGDEILGEQEVEDQPFVVWSPFPRAHRMIGDGLADKTRDIQRIKSAVLRQTLDGMFLTNQPRWWLPDESLNENTIDDLLTSTPGAPVRGKGVNPPAPMGNNFDLGKGLTLLGYVDSMRETRTGITRLNQGLDSDALTNKTATGLTNLQAQGAQLEEYVARNCAEALGRMATKLLRLMVANGAPYALKIDGAYRRLNPQSWGAAMNVTVNVGLGTGRKDQKLLYRQQVGAQQSEALANGVPIVSPKELYNNAVGYIRDAQLGNPDDFWINPENAPEQPKQDAQPDPALVKAQSDAAYQQQKGQIEAQQSQQKIQLTQAESQAKLQIAHEQGQQGLMVQQQRHEQEARLAAGKSDFEAQLAQQTADRNYELAVMQEQNRHALAIHSANHGHELAMEREKNKVPQERPGGALDQ